MPRRILSIASLLLGVALTVDSIVRLQHAQTTTAVSRLGLELSLGAMMVILGGVYLKHKSPK